MKTFVPYSETCSGKSTAVGGGLLDELGLNLGDLVPFQLDDECLPPGDELCDAEIHGPRDAWEGIED